MCLFETECLQDHVEQKPPSTMIGLSIGCKQGIHDLPVHFTQAP